MTLFQDFLTLVTLCFQQGNQKLLEKKKSQIYLLLVYTYYHENTTRAQFFVSVTFL